MNIANVCVLQKFLDLCNIPKYSVLTRMKYGITNKVYKLESANKNYLLKEYIGKCNDLCKNKLLEQCNKKKINVPVLLESKVVNGRKFCLYKYIEGEHKFQLENDNIDTLVDTIKRMAIPVRLNQYFSHSIIKKINQYIKILNEVKEPKISSNIIEELLSRYDFLKVDEQKFSFSIVHGDLSCVNLLWKEKELYVIDFDESIVAPKEYEIITTVIKVCFKYKDFDIKTASKILKAYFSLNNTSVEKLKTIWDFYILKVIIVKIALYQMEKIDIYDEKGLKDSWEYWYKLLQNKELKDQIFENVNSIC